jgi:hypothetical protein
MIPGFVDDFLGRFLAQQANRFGNIAHVAAAKGLGEIAAKMIRVEFRRRRVCGAGKNDNHGEC